MSVSDSSVINKSAKDKIVSEQPTGDTSFVVVIPARFQSSRLPGKVLADINGKPMIQWAVEKAQLSGARQVIVATDNDDQRVFYTLLRQSH